MTTTSGLVQRAYLYACNLIYGPLCKIYDPISNLISGGRWSSWLSAAAEECTDGTLLELGVGPGHLMHTLIKRGRSVIGVDLSYGMLHGAQKRFYDGGRRVPLVQADARQLPFVEQSFDMIVATFPAAYILERKTLLECRRVVRETDGEPQIRQLLIWGLWVDLPTMAWTQRLPVFYGRPSEEWCIRILACLQECGWTGEIKFKMVVDAEIGVVMARLDTTT